MVYYLNRGIILEQVICKQLENYFHSLHLENEYPNFHVDVTNDHPFARLDYGSGNIADSFPAIVVTTSTDRKIPELSQLIPQVTAISMDKEEFDGLAAEKSLNKAGLCTMIDDDSITAIDKYLTENDSISGFKIPQRKQETINIEIWAENNQLKNELYEQIRLFLPTLIYYIQNDFKAYAVAFDDNSIQGQRSNTYSNDFDVLLCGSHISLDVDYCIEQMVLDTDATINANLIWEVYNHVKGENNS